MGQRLNLEIVKGDHVLANAYYHWSGYTRSALEITNEALDQIYDIEFEKKYKNDIVKAVKILEYTGANLIESELEFGLNHIKEFSDYKFSDRTPNRNKGLISISQEGIEYTRTWEEARVTIDLLNKTVDFADMFFFPKDKDIEAEEIELEKLPVLEDYCLESIDFDDFDAFKKELENNELGFLKYKGDFLMFIE